MEDSFSKNLFITKKLEGNNGYAYTLASRLGEMLNMAEEMFGKRDRNYTILGIEFYDGNPQIWYPGDCKHIVIQLNRKALSSENEAYFELAQEVIHLLSPVQGKDVTLLEEGLAVVFTEHYLKKYFPKNTLQIKEQKYIEAKILVEKINLEIIKKLRSKISTFSDIKKEELICENIDSDLAKKLLMKFNTV